MVARKYNKLVLYSNKKEVDCITHSSATYRYIQTVASGSQEVAATLLLTRPKSDPSGEDPSPGCKKGKHRVRLVLSHKVEITAVRSGEGRSQG